MNTDLFSLREAEIFTTLKKLARCEFVIIGGYAVNAYTLPRFSVDCDIVLKEKEELRKIERVLLQDGYARVKTPVEAYTGAFSRYEKKLMNGFTVSMDVLLGSVTDRMTGASFSASWIFNHSTKQLLKGKTITEEVRLRIIDLDALLVMKIIACRSTDVRDVFMMLPSCRNQEWILAEITARAGAQDRVQKLLEKVDSKQFKDGLAGVYGRIDQHLFDKHRKAIMRLQKDV